MIRDEQGVWELKPDGGSAILTAIKFIMATYFSRQLLQQFGKALSGINQIVCAGKQVTDFKDMVKAFHRWDWCCNGCRFTITFRI